VNNEDNLKPWLIEVNASTAVVVAGARITTVESGAATKWKVVALDFSITVQSTRASKTAAGCIPKRGSKLYINPI
jgi:hypothetical protein